MPKKVSRDINKEQEEPLTFGQKAADSLARQAGSWRFIITFMVVLEHLDRASNSMAYIRNWDPYPFILLNLVLSCLAAHPGAGDHDEPEPAGGP